MNIWNSFQDSWGNKDYEYPSTYKYDFNRKPDVLCKTQDELMECVTDEYKKASSVTMWKSLLCKIDSQFFIDRDIQSMICRFEYCKKLNVPPFKGAYDDQPAYWVDFCNIMSSELMKCQNA